MKKQIFLSLGLLLTGYSYGTTYYYANWAWQYVAGAKRCLVGGGKEALKMGTPPALAAADKAIGCANDLYARAVYGKHADAVVINLLNSEKGMLNKPSDDDLCKMNRPQKEVILEIRNLQRNWKQN